MITISGAQGASFGPDQIPFGDLASSGNLVFQSLGVDELTFSINPAFLDSRDFQIPQEGQTIELFQSSQRIFKGIVSKVSNEWGSGSLSVDVLVSGPFWWLEQTSLTEIVGTGANEAERPQFRCELGAIEDHVTALFRRMIEIGLPVQLGEMDSLYDIPTTTFQNVSFARALSELLRLVPDAVGWWDYSGSEDPAFRISRRNTYAAQQFTLGVDPVISGSLTAEYSLKIERVSVPYAERLDDGSISFKELNAGPNYGTRQVVPVSGPELVDFVPPDPIDSVTVSTVNILSNSVSLNMNSLESVWEFWQQWSERYPSPAATRTPTEWTSGTNPSDYYPEGLRPYAYLEDGTKVDIATDNRWAISYSPDNEIPSWLKDVESVQNAKIRGTVWLFVDAAFDGQDWLLELINEADYVRTEVGGENNLDRHLFFDLDFDVVLLDRTLTDQTFYKPLAYIFETPPPNFANNLRIAQNWLPYVGNLKLQPDQDLFTRRIGSTINVLGGRSAWEQMGGLVQGETFDLFSKEQTLNLGLPERLSGETPVTRLERSSSDSLIIL